MREKIRQIEIEEAEKAKAEKEAREAKEDKVAEEISKPTKSVLDPKKEESVASAADQSITEGEQAVMSNSNKES